MYWPPRWMNNNTVTISDEKYAVDTGNPVRFASFAQTGCWLSPWLARTDQDTVWVPGDPMGRVLLIGDPPSQLLSFNESGTGAIIRLCDPPVGVQAWEVVSAFDWFEQPTMGVKVGAFAWARLWPSAPPPPGGPTLSGSPYITGGAQQMTWTFFNLSVPTLLYSIFVVHGDIASPAATVTLGVNAFTLIYAYLDATTNLCVGYYELQHVYPGFPENLVITLTNASHVQGYTLLMTGVTTSVGEPTNQVSGTSTVPTITNSGPTSAATSISLALVITNESPAPGTTFAAPFTYGINTLGSLCNMQIGYKLETVVTTISTSTLPTLPFLWNLSCVPVV